MITPFEAACKFVAADYSVIPLRLDGSKAPAVSWGEYQSRPPSGDELREWFNNGHDHGIGVCCGAVSKNLEGIDVDDVDLVAEFEHVVETTCPGLLDRIITIQTPRENGRGRQYWYRLPYEPAGNQVLAATVVNTTKGSETRVRIETRGRGGFFVAAGSPSAVHTSGLPYTRVRGPVFSSLTPITSLEHRKLFDVARLFTQVDFDAQSSAQLSKSSDYNGPPRPGDVFHASAAWQELLTAAGWALDHESDGCSYWRRPGKSAGHSAELGFLKDDKGIPLLSVFSSSCGALSPAPGQTVSVWDKFSFLAHTRYDGDFPMAASYAAEVYSSELKQAQLEFEKETGVEFAHEIDLAVDRAEGWPELPEEAMYGIAGEFVRWLEPHSESDPVGVLVQLLCAFGNLVGRVPYYAVESHRHYPRLFVCLVGRTGHGRKGTSWGYVQNLMERIDPEWTSDHIKTGMSSGEGLVYAVRDQITKTKDRKDPESGKMEQIEVIDDSGVTDKRALFLEDEFASVLTVAERQGNILTALIRRAWDDRDLQTVTKTCPLKATKPHVSVVGHVTRDDLTDRLRRVYVTNGFANRFLWICVQRSKYLPRGGCVDENEMDQFVDRFKAAVTFARAIEYPVEMDQYAQEAWEALYPQLGDGKRGLAGAMTDRAEPYVCRLALIYALLDESIKIKLDHLKAAVALWQYAEASVRYLLPASSGDRLGDQILSRLHAHPEGMSTSDIQGIFHRNVSAPEIGETLKRLLSMGLVRNEKRASGKPGRPPVLWFATERKNEETKELHRGKYSPEGWKFETALAEIGGMV